MTWKVHGNDTTDNAKNAVTIPPDIYQTIPLAVAVYVTEYHHARIT